jgi:hypothetical protein
VTGKLNTKKDEDRTFLADLGVKMWDNLPLLLGLDILCAAALGPALLLERFGLSIFAPVAAALFFCPAWMASTVLSSRIAAGDSACGLTELPRALFKHAVRGIAIGLGPAVAVTCLIGTAAVWERYPQEKWLSVPLATDASLVALALAGGLVAFSLSASDHLRGIDLWRSSFALLASSRRDPLAKLLFGLVVVSTVAILDLHLLILLSGPICMYISAVTRSARAANTEPTSEVPTESGHRRATAGPVRRSSQVAIGSRAEP